jgi:hypothetical protein
LNYKDMKRLIIPKVYDLLIVMKSDLQII